MNAVDVRGLDHRVNKVLGLEMDSLQLPKGQLSIIIGKNGAGKTTLLRMLAGLKAPDLGQIAILGQSLPVVPERLKDLVAWNPETTILPGGFSVLDIALLGRWPGCSSKDLTIVSELLEIFLPEIPVHSQARVLSTGEQKKLMLARTFAQKTPLVFLDEPLANLDLGSTFRIMDYLRTLTRKEGVTIVATMHHLEMALQYGDRLILLDQGKKICETEGNHDAMRRFLPSIFAIPKSYSDQFFSSNLRSNA